MSWEIGILELNLGGCGGSRSKIPEIAQGKGNVPKVAPMDCREPGAHEESDLAKKEVG